jgi:hypothetical protein
MAQLVVTQLEGSVGERDLTCLKYLKRSKGEIDLRSGLHAQGSGREQGRLQQLCAEHSTYLCFLQHDYPKIQLFAFVILPNDMGIMEAK